MSNTAPPPQSCNKLEVAQKRKKKRHSDLFNGLKKIVGSALGSSEYLENTIQLKVMSTNTVPEQQQMQHSLPTPCMKVKKRKIVDPVCAFSAKKKKDLLALFSSNSGGLLPNTPITKELKKSRSSLGGNQHVKHTHTTNPTVSSIERRWSVVGSGWTKQKIKNSVKVKDEVFSIEKDSLTEVKNNCLLNINFRHNEQSSSTHDNLVVFGNNEGLNNIEIMDIDCTCVSKNEYDAIKERVIAIENHISKEFKDICGNSSKNNCLDGVKDVEDKYKQTIKETKSLSSPAVEQLTKRLSRDLQIRQSIEQGIIRSPSARKIGTVRRRSQEKTRLSRNKSWHVTSLKPNKQIIQHDSLHTATSNSFYTKNYLKRGRPNTLQTGLTHHQYSPIIENVPRIDSYFEKSTSNEQWLPAKTFFNNVLENNIISDKSCQETKENTLQNLNKTEKNDTDFKTPIKKKNSRGTNYNLDILTPMLPPKSILRNHCLLKTPQSVTNISAKHLGITSTPIEEETNGRASIARLRTQNAGMVMAKAKLFDGMGEIKNPKVKELQTASSNKNFNLLQHTNSKTPPEIPITKTYSKFHMSVNPTKIDNNKVKSSAKSPLTTKQLQRQSMTTKSNRNTLKSAIQNEKFSQFSKQSLTKKFPNAKNNKANFNQRNLSNSPRKLRSVTITQLPVAKGK